MIKNEDFNINNIDGNINMISRRFKDINEYWIKEINTDGDSFNYDSQDIYRHIIDQMFLQSDLVEKINPETSKEERRDFLNELKEAINENIKLYENHKTLFADLYRKKLVIKELRRRKFPDSSKSDDALYETFQLAKSIQNREVYFITDLYEHIGFLEYNYHEEIYNYAIHYQRQIVNNFETYNKYDPNYLMIYNTSFFNMGVVYHIHNAFSGSVFHEITESELYKVINLQNTVSYLKIKDTQKLLYVIYRLSELLDENHRENWLRGILKEIQITKDYYYKKYKAVTWKNSSEDQKDFVAELDTVFKNNILPIVL